MGIDELATQGKYLRIHPIELKESQAMRPKRLYPGCVVKAAVRQLLVPLPLTARIGGVPDGSRTHRLDRNSMTEGTQPTAGVSGLIRALH